MQKRKDLFTRETILFFLKEQNHIFFINLPFRLTIQLLLLFSLEL
jgi:hypothetical protein